MVGFISRRKHLFLLLIYPLVGLGFAACEALVPQVVHAMEWVPVDRAIPFVPWMVWPYLFWYGAIAFALIWTGWNEDGREFRRLAWFIYLGMASAYVVYLVYPNGQLLRPPVESLGTGAEFDALRWLYAHDTPTNCNPSIHVIDMMAVWIALGRDRILGRRWWFQALLAVASLAVIASTVLIKQHSVLDVAGGLLWSGLLYLLLYRFGPK